MASDNRPPSAAAPLREEPAAGSLGGPASIPTVTLLEQVLDRANLQRAFKQVRHNKGAPGIDGMTVAALPEFLHDQWVTIRAQLVAGTYQPRPVKRVVIPKPDGGTRQLGIPTVLDRFIQQAIAQVVSAQWEPAFIVAATDFAQVARRTKRCVSFRQTFVTATHGWWIWTWRHSLIGSITTG